MSEPINTGGPAFPCKTNGLEQSFATEEQSLDGSRFVVVHNPGMSLRDLFAGMALQGIHASCTQGYPDPDFAAEKAYKQADEMIARRTKP